jgi:autotransporter-associated beta strand protein
LKTRVLFFVAAVLCLLAVNASGQLYWNTNGSSAVWTAANWSTDGLAPFATAWTANTNAIFSANSIVTFATTSIGDVTVNDGGYTVTVTQLGTLTTSSISTIYIGTGSTLTWNGQAMASSNGFIKNGSGIWNIGSVTSSYTGGFTLNAGTIVVSGNNSLGTATLTINGGTIQSSGTHTFAPTNIILGGDFIITGTPTFSGTVALGSAIRTITNDYNSNNNAITFNGIISNSGGGISFAATAGAVTAGSTIAITNTSNSYTGTTNVTGGEVTFPADGCLGAVPGSLIANGIVVDGGRLTLNPPASTSYTLNANRGIQVGATASTSISVKTGISVTYNGVIADKPSTVGVLAKQGAAILILGGVSTYSGATSINNGTIQLSGGNNRLPIGTILNIGQAANTNLGIFNLNGNNQEIAGLVSTAGSNVSVSKNTVTSSSPATLTISGSGTYSYGTGTTQNSGIISGLISLVKTGSGTQTLGDANTYTGLTTVSGGTLQLSYSGGNTIPATNDIVINSGGTLRVSSNQTVNNLTLNSGGTLTIDNGVTLTWTGSYTYNGGIVNGSGTLVPVEMTSFTAAAQKTNALLAWSTATEVNNYGFEIERRAIPSTVWAKVGFVAGSGTSNSPHNYSFTDAALASGNYAYRLKQIDNSGAFKYSQEVQIAIVTPEVFALDQNFPNPFNPATVIRYQLPAAGYVSLKVYDMLGREVATLVNEQKPAGSYHVAFDAHLLPSGVYFYSLQSKSFKETKEMVLIK